MNIVFHIGWPKTGTTSFQNWLMQNRPRLEAQGILYPETGRWREGSHHDLALSLRPIMGYSVPQPAPELWAALVREIQTKSRERSFHTVLITSELMPPLYEYKHILSLLEPVCSGMSVLAVVREQVALLRSLQRQMVFDPRIHMTCRVIQFFETAKQHYLFHEKLTEYKNALNWKAFNVLGYSEHIVGELLQCLGLDLEDAKAPMTNISVSYPVAEIIRQINTIKMPIELRQRISREIRTAPASPELARLLGPEISEQEAARIREFYRTSNNQLERDFGVCLSEPVTV